MALSNQEFSVLQALLASTGCDFVALGFGGQGLRLGREVESNAVDFLIHGLCKKLGKESIQNVRGVGWLMPRQDAV